MMGTEPFYKDGLCFACRQCSHCCRHEPGFVYLSEKDLTNILERYNFSKEDFIETYCRWVPYYDGAEVLCLLEKSNNDCIFWDNGCMIYEARPVQCSSYPFWDFIIASKKAWNEEALQCPGIDSGARHSFEEIFTVMMQNRNNKPVRKPCDSRTGCGF